jgi:hypothetical protein
MADVDRQNRYLIREKPPTAGPELLIGYLRSCRHISIYYYAPHGVGELVYPPTALGVHTPEDKFHAWQRETTNQRA